MLGELKLSGLGQGMLGSSEVLIIGGAGYIGSHTVLAFREAGHSVVVLDDLSTGHRWSVPDKVPFVEGSIGDRRLVDQLIRSHRIGAVVHLAGSSVVSDSIADPLKYYQNNVCASRELIQTCIDNGVRHFVFSSSAAVYGAPTCVPVSEDAPTFPISPYGTSKLIIEWMLRDTAAAHDFRYVALRYFNVAGADSAGRSGQSAPNATHLIKAASEAVVGHREYIEIFGEDYDTPDGTCIRDYIHVSDLATAHVHAIGHLAAINQNVVLNCGYGHGYSVREVLDVVQREAGFRLDVRSAPRRQGDAPASVAIAEKIRERFGWQPKFDDLGLIVRSAIAWERKCAARTEPRTSTR